MVNFNALNNPKHDYYLQTQMSFKLPCLIMRSNTIIQNARSSIIIQNTRSSMINQNARSNTIIQNTLLKNIEKIPCVNNVTNTTN